MASDYLVPILVVDDTASTRTIITLLLKKIGFKDVEVASDGEAALQKIRERKPGLVISDWNMQPMSGYDLLKAVRAAEALANIPFIMVTSYSDVNKVISARNAGVDGYITIPFTAETLKSKIDQALAGLGAQRR